MGVEWKYRDRHARGSIVLEGEGEVVSYMYRTTVSDRRRSVAVGTVKYERR